MSQNPQKLGYIHNTDIKETIDKVEKHIEVTNNRYQTIENFHNEIDNVQDSLNMQADNAIQRMDSISQKIKNYVNDLKNNSKLDFDLSEYTEYLESLDIGTIQQEKYTKLENFIKNRKPIEESIYKHDISPITDKDLENPNRILTKNTLINIIFHEKANDDVFNKIPYGLGRWEDAMLENRDKVLQIPINNNLKSFEFGIKYTQKFSCVEDKDKKLERYFAGKITLTGLLSNSDGQDKIPFSIKGVIYNADYDNTGLLGPKMTFKIACDKKYVYIWLDKVEPYRMIPVLDKSNEADNSVVLNMIDMAEANLSINYSNKNFTNYYVSETEKLNLDEHIGVNYNVSMSVYDTTAFDISNENNCMKIIDFNNDFIENVINNNNIFKKGDFEVKPASMGYTQLIGYGLSQTLNNPTNIVPENKVFEYRNFDMIEHDGSRIHKLPPMSRQIWDLIESDKRIQSDIRPEAFRRCGFVDNDPDTDYWYIWVEEDLMYALSNDLIMQSYSILLDDSKNLGEMTNNGICDAYGGCTSIPMMGKHLGYRSFLSKYRDTGYKKYSHSITSLSDRLYFGNRQSPNYQLTNKFFPAFSIITDLGNSDTSLTSARALSENYGGFSHFYDEYTGYWYVLSSYDLPEPHKLEWYRTKDIRRSKVEWLSVRQDIKKINTGVMIDNNPYAGPRMATDGNGRFVAIQFVSAETLVVVIYDNGDFSKPTIAKQITFSNNRSSLWNAAFASPYYHNLKTDGKGRWFIVGWTSQTTEGNLLTPYFISNDNGENWIRSDIKNLGQVYNLAIHPSEDKGIFSGLHYGCKHGLSSPHPKASLMFFVNASFSDVAANYGSRGRMVDRYPVDVERNNKDFQHMHVEIHPYAYVAESTPLIINAKRFGQLNSGVAAQRYHRYYFRYTATQVHADANYGQNMIYDEVNDFYYTGHGNNGMLCYDYAHYTSHWFTINRLYRVSKYDYSVQLIKNEHTTHGNDLVPTTSIDYTDRSWAQRKHFGSGSANKTISYSVDGHYNYLHDKLNHSLYRYCKYNKTLYMEKRGGRFKVTDGSTTPVSTSGIENAHYPPLYIPKANKYVHATNHRAIRIADSPEENNANWSTQKIVINIKNQHGGLLKASDKYSGCPYPWRFNQDRDEFHLLFYDEIEDILYGFAERGLHIYKNVDFSRKTNIDDQNTYNDNDYKYIDYPMWKDLLDKINNKETVPNSRWMEITGLALTTYLCGMWDKEQNKIIIPIGDSYYPHGYYILGERDRMGITEEYDRKYWKGFIVFDTDTHDMIFVTEALRQPGDGDDIDFIDPMDFGSKHIDTIWGRDSEGTYIVSPRTGNIYSVLDGWTRFEKRDCDYKMTQVVYNEKRNSYVTFVNNTPHEYAKNRYTRPQIREIPLTDIDYKIKPERSQEVRDSIIKELRKVAQKTNSEVFFKLEISIKPGKTYEDRYLLFYEDGVFAPNEENNMIMRYFVPDVVAGHKYTEATEGKNKYFTDFDLVKGYRMKNLNKIFSKIPGLRNRKWSEQIKMPLEDMEKLMKMPTKVKLTIYPTSGKMYNVDYAVNRNNTYSNKIYFGNVTENSKK